MSGINFMTAVFAGILLVIVLSFYENGRNYFIPGVPCEEPTSLFFSIPYLGCKAEERNYDYVFRRYVHLVRRELDNNMPRAWGKKSVFCVQWEKPEGKSE